MFSQHKSYDCHFYIQDVPEVMFTLGAKYPGTLYESGTAGDTYYVGIPYDQVVYLLSLGTCAPLGIELPEGESMDQFYSAPAQSGPSEEIALTLACDESTAEDEVSSDKEATATTTLAFEKVMVPTKGITFGEIPSSTALGEVEEKLDIKNRCWFKMFDESRHQELQEIERSEASVGLLGRIIAECEEWLSERVDLRLIEADGGKFHVASGGNQSPRDLWDAMRFLPPSTLVGARGKLMTGYELYLKQIEEDLDDDDGLVGHYRDLPRTLQIVATQPWYGIQQISDLITKLEGINYTYIQRRQEGLEMIADLAPFGRALYGFEDRFPGNREWFVCTVLGSWPRLMTNLRKALSFREHEKQMQSQPRSSGAGNGNSGAASEVPHDVTGAQNSMLLFLHTLEEMRAAIAGADGVFDQYGFEHHYDLHWVIAGGDHPSEGEGDAGDADNPDEAESSSKARLRKPVRFVGSKGKSTPRRKRTRATASDASMDEEGRMV
jgi:hypothetical protein